MKVLKQPCYARPLLRLLVTIEKIGEMDWMLSLSDEIHHFMIIMIHRKRKRSGGIIFQVEKLDGTDWIDRIRPMVFKTMVLPW